MYGQDNNQSDNSSGMVSGQLSFMKDKTQVVGLPIEVMDKVGTTLTEKYYKNRSAASAINQQILAIPDADNEVNRQAIKQISDQVSQKFGEFKKSDNWFDADQAVYQTGEDLLKNEDVKQLSSYAAMYNQTNKLISESKASPLYQQLAMAANKKMAADGFKKDGRYLGYQGVALSGDLDPTKYLKKINDLMASWHDTETTLGYSHDQVNMGTAPDGYKAVLDHFGTTTVKEISKDQVYAYAKSIVDADPNFQAEMKDIARLTLFG